MRSRFGRASLFVLLIAGFAVLPQRALARVRLESICTIYGQKEIKLTGIGLVVGLNGTGDGGRNLPAMRALSAVLARMNTPAALDELRDAKNVAMVLIEATIPRTGLRKGQRIDCHVSAFMGAKSLRGGRLLVTPVTTAALNDDTVVGLSSGALYIEDEDAKVTGRIPGGIVLEDNFPTLFVDRERGHLVTLLLDAPHATFHAASEVARVVNAEFSFESSGTRLARALGPGVVEVQIPRQYQDDPVTFLALLLAVGIDNPHTEARVVVNTRTGTVVVTGEVELSPVVISHKNLTVQVGNEPAAGGPAASQFVSLTDPEGTGAPQHLQDLMDALNQLRVPTSDVIDILRELHRSGKLHAVYEEH